MSYLKIFCMDFLLEIIGETLHKPIKTFTQCFEEKHTIFSIISLLGTNTTIPMQNTT